MEFIENAGVVSIRLGIRRRKGNVYPENEVGISLNLSITQLVKIIVLEKYNFKLFIYIAIIHHLII